MKLDMVSQLTSPRCNVYFERWIGSGDLQPLTRSQSGQRPLEQEMAALVETE
jgi:hypothetical protein